MKKQFQHLLILLLKETQWGEETFVSTFDELTPQACGFILSKCYPFTYFNRTFCADLNLQLCQLHIQCNPTHSEYDKIESI